MSERGRAGHLFEFLGAEIASSCKGAAKYHRQRLGYWNGEFDGAYEKLKDTIGAKVERQDHSGISYLNVVLDTGDPIAYDRARVADRKIRDHLKAAEEFESLAQVYQSQAGRIYELTGEDVEFFRLSGRRPDADDD